MKNSFHIKSFGLVVFWGVLGGIGASFLSGLAGLAISKVNDPTRWNALIFALTGVILAYPVGTALSCHVIHQKMGG